MMTFGWSNAHPFYVSVYEFKFENNRINLSARIFYDDLELAIKQFSNEKVSLFEESDLEKHRDIIAKYFKEHLELEINGEMLSFQYVGAEIEGEALWCYLESSPTTRPQKVWISNPMMTEVYSTQANLINFELDKKIKSLRLTKDQPEGRLTFKN